MSDEEYLDCIQTLASCQLLFKDKHVAQYLTSAINNNTQDASFLTGYIIAMITLKNFQSLEYSTEFSVKEFLSAYYIPSSDLYVIVHASKQYVVLNRMEYLILDYYNKHIRPLHSSERCKNKDDPFLLNSNDNKIRKPDILLRRLQLKFNLDVCTVNQAHSSLCKLLNNTADKDKVLIQNYLSRKTMWTDINDAETAVQIKNGVTRIIENLSATSFDITSEVKNNECDSSQNISTSNLNHQSNKFDRLLDYCPVNVSASCPTLSHVISLLDVSRIEAKRLIRRWDYRRNAERLKVLPSYFKTTPTKEMILEKANKIGWVLTLNRSGYEQIVQTCNSRKRKYNTSCLYITSLESHEALIKSKIANHHWESLFIKDNLAVRGRGVFACCKIEKNEIVCNYEGVYLNSTEGEAKYEAVGGCYFFKFKYDSKYHYIDCTEENNTFGRLINHSAMHPNIKPVPVDIYQNKKPQILFVAQRDINLGEELFWNYGKGANLDFYNECYCQECQGLNSALSVTI